MSDNNFKKQMAKLDKLANLPKNPTNSELVLHRIETNNLLPIYKAIASKKELLTKINQEQLLDDVLEELVTFTRDEYIHCLSYEEVLLAVITLFETNQFNQ